MHGYVLRQQILCCTDGSFDYAIRLHIGERTRKRCPVACDSLVLDLLDFNIYAVANRAPITGAGSQ
jgi:hypothetical protein